MSLVLAQMVSDFDWVYSDQGTGTADSFTVYRPRLPQDWYSLGDYAQPNYRPGQAAVAAVREDGGTGALLPPLTYEPCWNDRKSRGTYDGSLWYPVAPPGYAALGCVAANGYDMPPLDAVRCVRQDLVVPGAVRDVLYTNRGGKPETAKLSVWSVSALDHGGITAGTFLAARDWDRKPALPPYALSAALFPELPARGFDRKVLILGIDGCQRQSLRKLMAEGRVPNLGRLAGQGGLFDVLTDIAISGPGWSSMFTAVRHQEHAVVKNEFGNTQLNHYPHFFRRLKESDPRFFTASLGDLDFIKTELTVNADISRLVEKAEEVTAEAVELLLGTDTLDVLYLHFDNVDHAGHKDGYGSPEYLRQIEQVDRWTGELLEAIERRPTSSRESWLVLASTDHSGYGKQHSGERADRDSFILSSLPAEAPALRSVMDVPPTVARHLGVEVQASWRWLGQPLDLPGEPAAKLLARCHSPTVERGPSGPPH